MLAQLNRRNYVTPTNYLETVRGYRGLLTEKRAELGDKATKLKGGLEKLDETTVQVRGLAGGPFDAVVYLGPAGSCALFERGLRGAGQHHGAGEGRGVVSADGAIKGPACCSALLLLFAYFVSGDSRTLR